MNRWDKEIQLVIDIIDDCITNKNNEMLTLSFLAEKLGYSEYYVSRKFKETAGMNLRDYMRQRSLSFSLKEVRDKNKGLIDIALN